MAPSKTKGSDSNNMDDAREILVSPSDIESDQYTSQAHSRASKRRRLSDDDDDYSSSSSSFHSSSKQKQADSDSESESDSNEPIPAPAPLPVASRIKKKETQNIGREGVNTSTTTATAGPENPVSIGDALELGLQSTESTFSTMGVTPWLLGSLSNMAIRRPTAIQKACIPEILRGRDCIGGSRTGSGKTLAFAVPMLQKWAVDPFGVFGLVLTPTRYGS